MILRALLLSALFGPTEPGVHSGRLGQTAVRPPRLVGTIELDGALTEAQWAEASVLKGFSQYSPVDGVEATDSTEVRVWYSATHLYFGIRAFAPVGTVRATMAQRDQIFNDDNVQLLLSTFNDGRQASVFSVNPFGIQADGAINESGRGAACGGFNCGQQTREGTDLSQDFVWESKGRLTPEGYEVEIRIPFKSIRFQQAATQTWGINLIRVVQRLGQEQTWTMAKRGASSFLSQSGTLEGLSELKAGRALDIIPTLTTRIDGTPGAVEGKWGYDWGSPQIGGNVRYGITPNLTLNATANPDFSQVESDVSQFSFDPRQAIAYPERRPFFLDGIEQFDAPSNLIYTRRIVQPVVATKVTGKVSGTQIGVLAALDDQLASRADAQPVFGIVRVSRDLGSGGRLGFLWTEQHDGPNQNRVLDLDGRMVVNKVHSFTFAGALARDEQGAVINTAPLWNGSYRYSGRNVRSTFAFSGIHENFITRTGFISRPGVANGRLSNSYTFLTPTKTMQSLSGEIVLDGTWRYQDLMNGDPMQDRKMHFNFNARFKGGWGAGASLLDENFGYDPSIYAGYGILQPDGTIIPFPDQGRIPNRDYLVQGNTPVFKHFQFSGFLLWGKDENFPEWASGDLIYMTASATIRPTEQLRVNLSYNQQSVNRLTDGSRVTTQIVPRARIEYQVARVFQFRVVTEYALNSRDSLRDEGRTNLPLMIRGSSGIYTRAAAYRVGTLRTDLLFTYLPNPGTVVYLGYGGGFYETGEKGRMRFDRVKDGIFMKLSYLFRLQA